MRMILKVSMPTDVLNDMVREGTLTSTMDKLLAPLEPEAVYFTAMDGVRTVLVVVDLKEASDMVKAAEPFFLALEAEVEFYPAMLPEDLKKAAPHFERALREFGG